MAELVWINGVLVEPEQATVSVFDHGLTVGDGVFETIKAIDGHAFAVRRHLIRLRSSARRLGLTVPLGDDELRDAIAAVLSSSAHPLARLRITVTGGPAPLGSERGSTEPTVIIAAAVLRPPDASTAVWVAPWPRNDRGALAGVKTTSYAENVVALAEAKERDCSEAIFATTEGFLCEGTGSNVFIATDGRLRTPPLSSGCLAGVTRSLVLEVTEAAEDHIPMEEFLRADEVFLTSTGRDVQPVHRVNDRTLEPGPLTAAAAVALDALTRSNADP